MKCAEVKDLLGAFVDGELEADEAQAVAAELERCETCRADVERLRLGREALIAAMEQEADEVSFDGLWDRIAARIEPVAPPLPWSARLRARLGEFWARRRFVLMPAAGLAAAAILAVVVLTGGPTPPPAQPGGVEPPTLARIGRGAPDAVASEGRPLRRRAPEGMVASNEAFIEQYEVEAGTVVIDQDPEDPNQPLIVWHFLPEDAGAPGPEGDI